MNDLRSFSRKGQVKRTGTKGGVGLVTCCVREKPLNGSRIFPALKFDHSALTENVCQVLVGQLAPRDPRGLSLCCLQTLCFENVGCIYHMQRCELKNDY